MNDVVSSNILGGKTARACDSCLVKRARWFCPGDDAFLCQACDTSVHSASQLASRHKRVRLETSSLCKTRSGGSDPVLSPAWHQGFTRKARTPRQAKAPVRLGALANQQHLVPEMGSSEDSFVEESEDPEQLFCRVPVFDAFAEEFSTELIKGGEGFDIDEEIGGVMLENDLNLEELLSEGFLGNVDEFSYVKVEEKDDEEVKDVIACHFDPSLDVELNWDFDSTINKEDEMKMEMEIEMENESGKLLRLNYEEVIAAWDTQGSPWTDGIRPNLDEFMVPCLEEISHEWGRAGDHRANIAGREARVSRYREKRRTRLFSKKIRYEVRKLNADKRPRMKGRFVKKTAFSGSSLPYQHMNK